MANDHRQGSGIDRRDALKLAAAVTVTASLDMREALAAQARFLTAAEFALLDELAEQIIPADSHSGGARAAGVAAFIDGQLAEAWTDEERMVWRAGLAAMEDVSRRTTGRAFLEGSPAERLSVLATVASRETNPETPAERFFVTLKSRVAFAYYTSETGIKQEMAYLGNVYLDEFVGVDVRPARR